MHKTLAPLSLFPFAPVAMKRNPPTPTPATATLNPFQLEAAIDASNAALNAVMTSVDPENVATLGAAGGNFIESVEVINLRKAVAALILKAEQERTAVEMSKSYFAERHPEWERDCGDLVRILSRSALVDAETYEEAAEKFADQLSKDSGCPSALADLFSIISGRLSKLAEEEDEDDGRQRQTKA